MEKEIINNKAIEEFIFIAELSCECISYYLELEGDSKTLSTFLCDKIKWRMEEYYESRKTSLYRNNTFMFNKSVNINRKITSKLFDDIFFDEQGNKMKKYEKYELKANGYEIVTKTEKYEKYLQLEFGTDKLSEINYLSVKGNRTFSALLQNKNFIISLCEKAIKEIEATKKELSEEYYIRLENLIKKLEEYLNIIVTKAINIELSIKNWRAYLLEYSNKVLKAMPVEKVSEYNLKTRAFILKSLLDTLGIRNSQANIIRFIANIIGTSEGTVKGYFIEFNKDNHGMKKEESFIKEIDKAISVCKLLEDKSNKNGYIAEVIENINNIKKTQNRKQ